MLLSGVSTFRLNVHQRWWTMRVIFSTTTHDVNSVIWLVISKAAHTYPDGFSLSLFISFFGSSFVPFSVLVIVAYGSPVANEWTNGKWLNWLIGSLDAFFLSMNCLTFVVISVLSLTICIGTCSWASTRVKWWSKPWPKDWSLTVWRICAVLGIGWTLSSFSPVTPHWPSRSAISPDWEPSAYSAHSKPFPSSQVHTPIFLFYFMFLYPFSVFFNYYHYPSNY